MRLCSSSKAAIDRPKPHDTRHCTSNSIPAAGTPEGSGLSSMRGLPLIRAEDHRMDIAAWLRGLGLERYQQAFLENEIDGDALPKLTAEDLKDLDVVLG